MGFWLLRFNANLVPFRDLLDDGNDYEDDSGILELSIGIRGRWVGL